MAEAEYIPVAEVAAAAACWLARFRHGDDGLAITEAHPKLCRFCDKTMPALLTYSLDLCDPEELRDWKSQPSSIRDAAVRRAAEQEWWSDLPAIDGDMAPPAS